MYDGGKIITGLIIFLVVLAFPFWFNLGQAAYKAPELKLPKEEKECVKSKQWMRENHMKLLNDWRDEVVRYGKLMYISSDGKEYEMSLQKTCMDCHTEKKEFCDKCHNTASVSPYCWDCHVAPEEVSNGQ